MSIPLVPETRTGSGNRLLRLLVGGVVRLSLLVRPRPAALLLRLVFAAGGAEFKRSLDRPGWPWATSTSPTSTPPRRASSLPANDNSCVDKSM